MNRSKIVAVMKSANRAGLDPYNSATAYARKYRRNWERNAVRREYDAHRVLCADGCLNTLVQS